MKKPSLFLLATVGTIGTALLIPHAHGEALFEGTPDKAQFVLNFGAVSSGDAVNVDTIDSDETWRTWLFTRPEVIVFKPGKRYRVSWDFEVQKNKSQETFFYYYLQSDAGETSRRGNGRWVAKDGESGHMEVTATLGSLDGYVFALGNCNGGAIAIKNLKIEEVPPPKLDKKFLYQPPFENDGRLNLNLAGRIVEGGFEVDTTTAGREWSDFLGTSPTVMPLQPGHTYRVAFSYHVKKLSDKETPSMVCHLAESSRENAEKQWNSWPVSDGESGQKKFNFTVYEPGCSIRLGDHNGVSARIEDFSIEDIGK